MVKPDFTSGLSDFIAFSHINHIEEISEAVPSNVVATKHRWLLSAGTVVNPN